MPTSALEKTGLGGLFLVGATLSFSGSYIVGGVLGTAVYWYMRKKNIGLIEAAIATGGTIKDCFTSVIDELSRPAEGHTGEIISAVLEQIPVLKHFELEMRQSLDAEGEWLEALVRMNPKTERMRSFGVLGEPGDGKSWILRFVILRFLDQYPNGRIFIHDMELKETTKKLGDGAWFGLPVGTVVYETPEDFKHIIKFVSKELDSPTDDSPILLVVDEMNNLLKKFSEKEQGRIMSALDDIKNRGGKRRIQFAIASQASDVKGSGLSEAFIRALDWVILRTAAQVGSIHRNMGLRESQKKQFDDMVDDLEGLPEIEGVYPCITYVEKKLTLTAVPDLGWMPMQLTIKSPAEASLEWFRRILAAHPDLLSKVQEGQLTSRTQFGNALDAILRDAGEPLLRRRDTDLRWKEIREHWDSMVAGEFPPRNDALESCTESSDLALPHGERDSEITDSELVQHYLAECTTAPNL